MFTPALTAIAQDRVQQLREEARRDGDARLVRAAARVTRRLPR